jgi:hypothetical protein
MTEYPTIGVEPLQKQAAQVDKVIRVFSKRRNEYIEVSLSGDNAVEDQLGGIMPVMLVTDHPLSN